MGERENFFLIIILIIIFNYNYFVVCISENMLQINNILGIKQIKLILYNKTIKIYLQTLLGIRCIFRADSGTRSLLTLGGRAVGHSRDAQAQERLCSLNVWRSDLTLLKNIFLAK